MPDPIPKHLMDPASRFNDPAKDPEFEYREEAGELEAMAARDEHEERSVEQLQEAEEADEEEK